MEWVEFNLTTYPRGGNMKISIPKERREHEKRVAATPDTIKKYISLGFDVTVRQDLTRAIDLDGSLADALAQMQAAGLKVED